MVLGNTVDGVTVGRWLVGAAQVDGGATAEQMSLIQNLLHGYFGAGVDAAALEPDAPEDIPAAAMDSAERRRLVDLLVVLEFCRHPGDAGQAGRVEQYACALDADQPLMTVARDALTAGQTEVMADWSRFREATVFEPGHETADEELAARLRALADCPPASLGRAYFDFYERWDISFPGEAGGGDASLVAHDFSHVLAGYDPDAPGELALQAVLTSATDFEHHFSGLVASLALYEAGKFEILDITPKFAALNRPGATGELADAFRRGESCRCDFSAIDHLARADEPLRAVQAECGIPPREA
jgi:hypothetical protein